MSSNEHHSTGRQRTTLLLLITVFLASLALLLLLMARDAERAGQPVDEVAGAAVAQPATPADSATFERGNEAKAVPSASPAAVEPATWPATIPAGIEQIVLPADAYAELTQLEQLSLPAHDPFETAQRLGKFDLGPRTVSLPAARPGQRETFYAAGGPLQAELQLITDHGYYWTELGLNLNPDTLAMAADRVEREMWPVLAASFGREWSPGVDQDPRYHVFHVLGAPEAAELGYFIDENQFPMTLFAESNEREMVYLNMASLELGTDLYVGTLVHELQHLIHWNLDPNEEVWLNEGFSQLAETMMGLDTVSVTPYLENPQIRLDAWTTQPPDVFAHYAGSYLFLRYLEQRLGAGAMSELARHPANGMAAVRTLLAAYAPELSWERLMTDFAVALYRDDAAAGPQYEFAGLDLPQPSLATRARTLPFTTIRGLPQLGIDYIDLDLSGVAALTFAGDTAAPLTSGPPPDGGAFWFASPGNSSRALLTAEVDLAGLPAPVLSFDAWHDLEPGWDFAYVSASVDGGRSWELLRPIPAADGRYGPALGGQSEGADGRVPGWQPYTVSLAAYAGLPVRLAIEVLSDAEGLSGGVGLASLDIAGLAERGGELAWQGDGFVNTEWRVPQKWGVALIEDGAAPAVHILDVGADGLAQARLNLGEDGATLVVIPLTTAARSEATYWVAVEPWEVVFPETE